MVIPHPLETSVLALVRQYGAAKVVRAVALVHGRDVSSKVRLGDSVSLAVVADRIALQESAREQIPDTGTR